MTRARSKMTCRNRILLRVLSCNCKDGTRFFITKKARHPLNGNLNVLFTSNFWERECTI